MHYTHGTSLLYFQHAISSKFPDRYSNATLNERESVLLSDEWETGNVRLREEGGRSRLINTPLFPHACVLPIVGRGKN